ncbi:hypothetical protein L5D93_08415 [Paenibacillus thiaminolyticus]|nr:hypothetical protein [Paenibacillus thiaminolyticus]
MKTPKWGGLRGMLALMLSIVMVVSTAAPLRLRWHAFRTSAAIGRKRR